MTKEIENIEILREHLAELLKFAEGEENEFIDETKWQNEPIEKFYESLLNVDTYEKNDVKDLILETFRDYLGLENIDDKLKFYEFLQRVRDGKIKKEAIEELSNTIYTLDLYIEENKKELEETIEEEIPAEEFEEIPEETIEEEIPAEEIEENNDELPAITEYRKETERLEKELEELLSRVNPTKEDKELSEMDEIINNTTYPEIENNDNKISEVKEEINKINNDIIDQSEQKERYEKLKSDYDKFYDEQKIPKTNGDYRQKMEIYDKRIKECDNNIRSLSAKKSNKESELQMLIAKNSEINGPLIKIETWKFAELYQKEVERLENNLEELKEIEQKYYKESKGVPLEIYGMQTKLENQIKEMKEIYTKTVGIRSEINLNNPEFKPVLDAVKNGRKLNHDINKELDENYKTEKKQTNDEELNKRIEELKEEIQNRRENIAKYEDALKDIREIENDIKSGKKPEDEEIKNKVDIVNNKINAITDEKLQEELREQLKKALERKKNLPVPITNIEKKPKVTWKTIGMLAAGLGLGATIGFVAPTGIIIATGIGVALAKWKVSKLRKAAEQRRLKGETEIKAIELPNNKIKAAIVKFKQYIKSEEGLRDISWGLTGGLIGLALGKFAKGYTNFGQDNFEDLNNTSKLTSESQLETPYDLSTPTENIQDIRLGESIEGYDITQGHDTASWAVNNINPENLISEYVNGDSVFQRFAKVNPDGSIGNIISTNGTSLTDIINNTGLSADQIAIDVGKNGVSQAWIKAADVLGKGLGR